MLTVGNPTTMQPCVKRFCPTHIHKKVTTKGAELYRGNAECSMKFLTRKGHVTGIAYSLYGNEIIANYSGDSTYLFDIDNCTETSR